MRWLKRILLGVAILLVLALMLVAGGWWQLSGTPEWWMQPLSEAEASAAADRAEQAWIRAQSRIAEAHARQFQVHDADDPAATQRVLEENRPIRVSFTAAELNALFQKWSHTQGWDAKLRAYLRDPQIVLHGGRVILAGDVKDVDWLPDMKASAHFEPSITPDGRMSLRLVRTMGGRAPLPEALWREQRVRLIEAIRRRLPPLQQQARIGPDGDANDSAIEAAMGRLLLQMLNHETSEPVVFIPLNVGGFATRKIPVRVTEIQVRAAAPGEPERLTMTVQPMTRDERAAFLARIREPYSTATARVE